MTNDKLVTTSNITKLSSRSVGMNARVQQAASQGTLASSLLDYTKYPNRIVLLIDDSGSMSTTMSKPTDYPTEKAYEQDSTKNNSRMEICRLACQEFINVCSPHDTALGMYTISTNKDFSLSTNFIHLLSEVKCLEASGGTPTIQRLDNILSKENVTRVVIVSDGESGALNYDNQFTVRARQTLDVYKEKKIVIDTVFIGTPESNGEREMKLIAEHAGGLFLVFKSGESFRTKFKYLAPAYRGMLVSGEVKI